MRGTGGHREAARRARAAGLLLAAALGMTGCWAQPGATSGGQNHNALESTLTAANVGTLAPAWSTPGAITAVWGGTAYGVAGTRLQALDAASGAVAWTAQLPTIAPGEIQPLLGPVVSGPDVLLSYENEFRAPPEGQLTTENGALRWDLTTGALTGVLSDMPLVGNLRTVNVVAGADLVAYERTGASGATLQVVSTEAEPTPAPQLTRNVRLWSGFGGDTATPPIFAGRDLLDADFATLRSFVAAGCGAPTCEPTWTVYLGRPITSLAAGPGNLAFAVLDATQTAPAAIVAIDRTTGATRWRLSLEAPSIDFPEPVTAELAVVGDVLYVGAGRVVAAYPADTACEPLACGPLWSELLPDVVSGNLAAAGGVLYAGSEDGTVSAFNLTACSVWNCPPLATVTVAGAPDRLVVSAGRLFVGTPGTTPANATTAVFAPTG